MEHLSEKFYKVLILERIITHYSKTLTLITMNGLKNFKWINENMLAINDRINTDPYTFGF